MPSLRDITQDQAVRAFVRMGGTARRGKGSHRVVNLNGINFSFPRGILKIGLLRHHIKAAGKTEEEFLAQL